MLSLIPKRKATLALVLKCYVQGIAYFDAYIVAI
jgi:hypothetical protein